MTNLGDLQLNYLDYMLVVNRDYTIAYSSRYDLGPLRGGPGSEAERDKNFFEVYPSISRESSSIVRCMTTGEIVVKQNQRFVDFNGKIFRTNNISIPLIRQGQIVGVVELSRDLTTVENLSNKASEIAEEQQFELIASTLRAGSALSFGDILTVNPQMLALIEKAKQLARLPIHTLITGETGTGKELFAQAMISHSGFDAKRVIVQNCASIPENLAESILFGTTRGAYTGAENTTGLFEAADGGIFFLDELNSLPYHIQGKLLRVLQDGSFRPVGASREKKVNVKIIAAINVDPMEAIHKKELRSDLFYRLSSNMLSLIPLRRRKDDILFYTSHYLGQCNLAFGKSVAGITDSLRDIFLNYSWDGNVRELKNIIESMVSVSNGPLLDEKDLPAYMYPCNMPWHCHKSCRHSSRRRKRRS